MRNFATKFNKCGTKPKQLDCLFFVFWETFFDFLVFYFARRNSKHTHTHTHTHTEKKKKAKTWGLRWGNKTIKISDIFKFSILPTPKIENSVIQKLKINKINELRQKLKGYDMVL